MLVSWVTFAPTNGSVVRYGLKGKSFTSSASGNMTKFEDSSVVRYMHVVQLKGLQPGEAYGGYTCTKERAYSIFNIAGLVVCMLCI